MADIKMLLQNYVSQDDDQGDEEDYSKYYESSMIDQANSDELLTPLEKLNKYCTNENIFTRQMVARSIVETVQSISNEQECYSLLEIITKLSDDIEPSVRCELMEQLPPCSMMMMDMKIIPDAISTFILPVMVKYLTDTNNQVRKLSQNALLQLMDQDLIKKEDVESQICPVILSLTESESSDDFRTEAVALMTKIAMVLGDELTEKLFLQRFGKLCADALFHVRKGCASNFGEIASVVRRETVEKLLLPLFARLCEDGVWGVRKACAETFVVVSEICSKTLRYQTLAPLFVGLLCDKSRWVQMAAYQDLGQFIATFAEPERTGFKVSAEGNLVPYTPLNLTFACEREVGSPSSFAEDPSLESDRQVSRGTSESDEAMTTDDYSLTLQPSSDETLETFNNFEFWRTPLPSVDLANELIGLSLPDSQHVDDALTNNEDLIESSGVEKGALDTSAPSGNCSTEKVQGEAVKTYVIIDSSTEGSREENLISEDEEIANAVKSICEDLANDCDENLRKDVENINEDNQNNIINQSDKQNELSIEKKVSQDDVFALSDFCRVFYSDDENTEDENSSTLPYNSQYSSNLISNENLHNQSIVPPALLEHFISMIDPNKNKTIDGDLPRHCAFTLPGVVLALGRENWDLLRDTYVTLSTNMQWKVRRTLAFSMHDLAQILGEQICVDDLVNVFNQFLKDLDEVRVGVLKNLFNFINILPRKQQKDYLPLFCEFQKTDNYRNWRFRKDLAEQLICLVELYNEEEVSEYLCPVALELASDKVADVRENAYNLLCILLHKLYDYEDSHLYHKFVTSIITLGTHHQHWVKRKACGQIYCKLLEMEWYDKAHLARDFLPSLLNLCADVVPNVRMISSKSLLSISKSDYYQCLPEDDEVRKHVDHALETLQSDEDRDVRFFSGGKVEESDADTIPLDEDENARYYSDADVEFENKFSKMTLEMALDSDSDSFFYSQDGVTVVHHDVNITNNDGDGTEVVEEVYIEEQSDNNISDGDIIMEEFYIEQPSSTVDKTTTGDPLQTYYVEEIIEEIIETDS